MNQPHLLPPSSAELVDPDPRVGAVNRVIDPLDLSVVLAKYKDLIELIEQAEYGDEDLI
ncbi:MAG TPA: hypothetical protein VF498_12050 [Anaerolineales bacterium]